MQKIPILFIIFNRKEISLNSFWQIKQYQPDKLYIAADGPRNNEESILCDATRDAVRSQIDWECDVKLLFREENLGVDLAVYSAISWMFEFEKWGVIVEDDCFMSVDFFRFCETAFIKYENCTDVVHIAANNIFAIESENDKVRFGDFPYSWGWGTWKRAWEDVMDIEMKRWDNYKLSKAVFDFGFFRGIMLYNYWHESYINREKIQTWDSIWQFSVMSLNKLCLMTGANLAINKGIGTSEGSHYKKGDKNFFDYLKLDHLSFPIKYPVENIYDKKLNRLNKKYFLKLRIFGVKQKVIKMFIK